MIGKPEWFTRRKYLGWGIMPKTWQGWAYLIGIILPMFAIQFIPQVDRRGQGIFLAVWALIIVVDVIDIMVHMRTDERERVHEAIAERNALWAMVAVLAVGISYQAAQSMVREGAPGFDPVIIIALIVALVAKAGTNIYLDRKD